MGKAGDRIRVGAGALLLLCVATPAAAATDPNAIRPRVLVVVDSSGSMHLSARFFDFGDSITFGRVVDGLATHGDGSDEQTGCDIDASNGLTLGRPNDSRLFQAKKALQNLLRTRAFRYPSNGLFGENNSAPPVGSIDFALASWRKTRGGMSCAGAEGTQSTCPAGLLCWDDNLNGFNRICAVRASDAYFECSPFTWDEPSSSFTCAATSCPTSGIASESPRNQCNYYRVADTAHGDISPFDGSTVICPNLAGDNQFMTYAPITCAAGGGEVLGPFPLLPTNTSFQESWEWIDHTQPRQANDSVLKELRAIGNSPIAAALRDMRTYLATGLSGFQAPIANDCSAGCRSYDVILISDGTDSCESIQNAAAAAAQLLGPFTVATPGCSSPSVQVSVRTHVVAFPGCAEGVSDCAVKSDLDQIAQSGGTGVAAIARNDAELQTALITIVDRLRTTATVSGSTTVCSGSTGGVATAANATAWGFRTVSGGTITPIQGASIPTYAINASDFPGSGSYFLVAGKCAFGSISDEIPVTVFSTPDATISAPSQLRAMTDGAAAVPDAGGGATYTWTVSGAAFTGQGTRAIAFNASAPGVVTLDVTVQNPSGCSATDHHIVNIISAGTTFTDDPLVSSVTIVKSVHLVELRVAVNAVRARAGLVAATWAESIEAGSVIKAAHINELRSALTPALTALGVTPSFTDAPLSSGIPIKAVHVQEIREYAR